MGRILLLAPVLLLLAACATDVIDHSLEPEVTPELGCFGLIERMKPDSGNIEIRIVSEYGGSPIGGVAVRINEQPWMATDAQGMLTVADPGGPYSILVHQISRSGDAPFLRRHDDSWQFHGLTSNALTICADGSTVPQRTGHLTGTINGGAPEKWVPSRTAPSPGIRAWLIARPISASVVLGAKAGRCETRTFGRSKGATIEVVCLRSAI